MPEAPAGPSTTTGASDSAPSAGGLSLEDAIGSLMGDGYESEATDGGESPVSQPSDAAGAPPAERQDGETAPPKAPEGTATAERAGAPPADAAKPTATPDAAVPAPTPPPADDPLATATPFTYVVNGESRAFDGIKVLGEHGAIVEPQAVELLQRRLGERDHLFETSRQQYAQVQHYERLSAWHSKDAEGKETTVSGPEGLMTMRATVGKLAASMETFASLFQPDAQGRYAKLASLIGVNERNEIVPDQAALRNLFTEADLAELRAEQAVRAELAKLVSAPSPGASAASSAPLDAATVTAHAPAIIEASVKAAGADASVLTPKDRESLAAQLPRYIRSVTHEDRQANPTLTLGGPIVDRAFTELVKERAALRAELAQTARSTADAATENAKKLAAAALGTKTPSAAAARPAPPAPPPNAEARSRASDAEQAWALRERMASGRFSS